MNELVASILGEARSRPCPALVRRLADLLRKFYLKYNPLKCDSSEGVAEYYITNLPLLSQKLLATYGSDLCCVLDDSKNSK